MEDYIDELISYLDELSDDECQRQVNHYTDYLHKRHCITYDDCVKQLGSPRELAARILNDQATSSHRSYVNKYLWWSLGIGTALMVGLLSVFPLAVGVILFILAILAGGVTLALGLSAGLLGLVIAGGLVLLVGGLVLFLGVVIGIPLLLLVLILLFWNWLRNGIRPGAFWSLKRNHVQFEKSFSQSLAEFDSIDIDTKFEVIIQTGTKFYMTVESIKGVQLVSEVREHRLYLTQTGKAHHAHIQGLISVTVNNEQAIDGRVTITLPPDQPLSDVIQHDRNQNLKLNDVEVQTQLAVHGSVALNQVTAPAMNYQSADGLLSVDHSHFERQDSTLHLRDGIVKINDSTFKSFSQLKINDGTIRIKNSQILNDDSQITARDGLVVLEQNEWQSLNIGIHDGSVKFKDQTIDQNLVINLNDGIIHGQLLENDDVHIHASCRYGVLKIKAGLSNVNADKDYYFRVKDGSLSIK